MKAICAFLLLSLFYGPAFAQTRLEAQGGSTPCEWIDKSGRRGKSLCNILEQGTIGGKTTSVISVTNPKLAYSLDYDKFTADLVSVSPNGYKTLWHGKFRNRYYKTDPLLETIIISDGITLTIKRF